MPAEPKIHRDMGCEYQYSNYRPISLLPVFSKLLERIFNNRLMNFVHKHKLLQDGQYGFRCNHSTELAVLEMIEKISDSIDKKLFSVGIFVDLKKAFDTINHNILIKKLDMCFRMDKKLFTKQISVCKF